MSEPLIRVTHTHRHVWGAHEGEEVTYDYDDRWYDDKGTMFSVKSLARMRDSYDYAIFAYPFFKPHAGSDNYSFNSAILGWKRTILGTEMLDMSAEAFVKRMQEDVHDFESFFYSRVNTMDDVPAINSVKSSWYHFESTDEPVWYRR